MNQILVLGAGRSSSNLIQYLLQHAENEGWKVRVGDLDIQFAQSKVGHSPFGEVFQLDGQNPDQRRAEIAQANLVISMLPAFMHMEVAKDCLAAGKNLITPSYIPDEMWELDAIAKEKGLVLLNEMGVDPGIDHMSAMEIIHAINEKGGKLLSFESFTGGLIAPESDNNPWNYKITWNPRNVVLAGYGGTARFQKDGETKYIPYHRLFQEVTDIEVAPMGKFDGYANRDSLKYKKIYNLESIPTLYRGTLRRGGFCKAWNVLIQLGLTDDSFEIEQPQSKSWRQLTSSFVEVPAGGRLEDVVKTKFACDEEMMMKLTWLGIFENAPLDITKGTPAVALQRLIETKWKLDEGDKDMIVMWHRFYFELGGKKYCTTSSLITEGDDTTYTAMSKTVGLPIAIAAKLILNGSMKLSGVHLPIIPEIYRPVMDELKSLGIVFNEETSEVN